MANGQDAAQEAARRVLVGAMAKQYTEAGMVLVDIDLGTKGPTHARWNWRQACISEPEVAETLTRNIGLAHAWSRTCALDLDDLEKARVWLAERGVDVDALLDAVDAVGVASGRPNRAKLIYRLPAGVEPLPSKTPSGSGLELRCATEAGLTVQDVLPPSIHPDTGRPYEWRLGLLGDWASLPELPAELLDLWRAQLSPTQDRRPREPLGLETDRLRGVLARIDPDAGYNDWSRVGAALHHESGGAEWGLDLWDEWSATGSKYKGRGDLVPHWRSWGRYKGRPVTAQWLLGQAGGCSADEFDDLSAIPQPDTQPKLPRFSVMPIDGFSVGVEPEWLIKGVLPRAGLAVIYGESGSGKSFVTLDLGFAMALGKEWNGCRTRKARIVYVVAEGQSGFRNRVRAFAQHYGVSLKDIRIGVVTDIPNLLTADHARLAEQINAWGGADIIIIDTLAQTTPGSNENSSEDMGKALAHCRALHTATGALVVLVHHAGKDATRGARGWSGLKAAADAELEISRDEDRRSIKLTKQKDGEDGRAWAFRLQSVDLGTDSDGDPVTSCVVEYIERTVHLREPRGKWQKMVWLAVLDGADLCDGGVTVEAVLSAAVERMPADTEGKDRRRENAKRALDQLVVDERLVIQEGYVRVSGAD